MSLIFILSTRKKQTKPPQQQTNKQTIKKTKNKKKTNQQTKTIEESLFAIILLYKLSLFVLIYCCKQIIFLIWLAICVTTIICKYLTENKIQQTNKLWSKYQDALFSKMLWAQHDCFKHQLISCLFCDY